MTDENNEIVTSGEIPFEQANTEELHKRRVHLGRMSKRGQRVSSMSRKTRSR